MNILGLTLDEVVESVAQRHGRGLHHAAAAYREVFQRGNTRLVDCPGFESSDRLASALTGEISLPACRIVEQHGDGDVLKFVSALDDGLRIESVLIPAENRTTLCVSSQVGCAMGCRFCVTGRMGLQRNLRAEEIVWQVFAARFLLHRPVDNVVFMGMGEPLDNLDAVARAIRILGEQRGLNIANRHITVSTAGHVDGLRALAALGLRNLRLAVSLNAADDSLRDRLMPINRRYPLALLKQALLALPRTPREVVLVEYVLIAGVNDRESDAMQVVRFLDGLPARVNLIGLNGGFGEYAPPAPDHIRQFADWLAEAGLFVRVRPSRGPDVMAACGQLGGAAACAGMREDQADQADPSDWNLVAKTFHRS